MLNSISGLLEKMTPEEQAEVETFAGYLLARRTARKLYLLTDEASSQELLKIADRSGSFEWLDAEDEDVYSVHDGDEVEWPSES
jgi:hypothetical protein